MTSKSGLLRGALLAAMAAMAALCGLAAPASAASFEPALEISALSTPTAFVPGDESNLYTYEVRLLNVGGAATDGSDITISDTLPPGLTVKSLGLELRSSISGTGRFDYGPLAITPLGICETQTSGEVQVLTCTISESIPEAREPALISPGEERRLAINVSTPAGAEPGRTLVNRVAVEGGGAQPVVASSVNSVAASDGEGGFLPASSGVSLFHSLILGPDGRPQTQAGSHPYEFVTSFAVNTKQPSPASASSAAFVPAGGDIKDIPVTLPQGLIGNPTAVPRCTQQQFTSLHTISFGSGAETSFYEANACPLGSVVGFVVVQQIEGESESLPVPLYDLVPPPGMPAQLGAQVLGLPFYIDTEVLPADHYKVVAGLRNLTEAKRLTASSVVIWGAPGEASHDPIRGECLNEIVEVAPISRGQCPTGEPSTKPFLRMPTSCESPLETTFSFDNWTNPGAFIGPDTDAGATPSGCELLRYQPDLKLRPTTQTAESPTGLHVDLHVPQNEDPNGLATPDLRNAVVKLPPGLTVNPSSANGLAACSPAQFGLETPVGTTPIETSSAPAACPDAAEIGSVEVDTPLLDHPLPGFVYVATPYENPFGSLLAIYVAVDDPVSGVVIKLAGDVEIGSDGQLTTRFDENPQLPFDDFKLDFFEGPRAALKTPVLCGDYTTTSSLTPWSAPGSGPSATPSDAYRIDSQPGGGACPTSPGGQPNRPGFEAGTESPLAGAFSPFILRLTRDDGTQQFSSITVSPPPGLLGRLAGIPYCPDPVLASAAYRSGREERASPSCPPASEVGVVDVGAGAGPSPYYVQGHAYLAGPYKGAPLSLAIVTPAVAGPYDLGTVVVRAALEVDPSTTQIAVKSDPIPTELKGIPLDIRSIVVKMNRPDFTLNPTNCEAMAVGGSLTSTVGQTVTLGNRFQAGDCGNLGFKPELSIKLMGATRKAGHPALKAVVTYPKKGAYANIARAQVNLPHSEFIDQGNLNKVCTRPSLLAGNCPKSTIYGRVKAWTPLLDRPLQGHVYLVGGYGYKLPALVAELNGQIRVLLVGKVDSGPNHGIRNTFEMVPDAPVERFVLEMKGGPKYSLLENSEDLCAKPQRAIARFTGQNGRVDQYKPRVGNDCRPKANRRRQHTHHRLARSPTGRPR